MKAAKLFIVYSTYSIPHRQAVPFCVFDSASEAVEFWSKPGCAPWSDIDGITPPVTATSIDDLANDGIFETALAFSPDAPESGWDELTLLERDTLKIVEMVKAGKTVTYWQDNDGIYWGTNAEAMMLNFATSVPTHDDFVCTFEAGEELPASVAEWLSDEERGDLIAA